MLNTKIRLTMLCLSGFELHSRWVPLITTSQLSRWWKILKNIYSGRRKLSKSSPKHTFLRGTRKEGMMRLLSLGHLSFRMWSKKQGVINHWLRRQTDKKFPVIFSSICILLVLISSTSPTIQANKLSYTRRSEGKGRLYTGYVVLSISTRKHI